MSPSRRFQLFAELWSNREVRPWATRTVMTQSNGGRVPRVQPSCSRQRAGSASPGGPSGSSVRRPEEDRRNLVEIVYPGGVASGDLGLLLFSAVSQNLLDDLMAPGESGFDMG